MLAVVRQTRGGKLYDADFERRQTGEGAYAQMLGQRFANAVRRLGLERRDETMNRLISTAAWTTRSCACFDRIRLRAAQ